MSTMVLQLLSKSDGTATCTVNPCWVSIGPDIALMVITHVVLHCTLSIMCMICSICSAVTYARSTTVMRSCSNDHHVGHYTACAYRHHTGMS